MKKIYIQPRTTFITVVFQQAFLTSSTIDVKSTDYDESMTDLSRDGSGFWDDDIE